ncbi:type III toxin-antitoxin system ToxN/AbiQ family toxin [Vibrio harveyi]|uniref:type III toxin-antitoxin system ToxN/AbiQ family toxin n=1 Tax=Vibrio harveyi TaxID=669 RepID=UPI003BF6B8E3
MKFYVVNDDYIEHLIKVDGHVYKNKAGRPYIGVLFEVNGSKFLAPLTSHKEKHDRIPDTSPLIFKMYELGSESSESEESGEVKEVNKLGMVQLNNMIPVPDSEMELLNVDSRDAKYRNLLDMQQQYLRKHQEEFQKKARKLYNIVKGGHAKGLISKCCDFTALEAAMLNYSSKAQQPASQTKLDALASMFEKK